MCAPFVLLRCLFIQANVLSLCCPHKSDNTECSLQIVTQSKFACNLTTTQRPLFSSFSQTSESHRLLDLENHGILYIHGFRLRSVSLLGVYVGLGVPNRSRVLCAQ